MKTLPLLLRLVTLALLAGCAAPPTGGQPAAPDAPYRTTRYGFVRDWLQLGPIVYGREAGDPMQGHPINYDRLQREGLTDPTWKDWIGNEWRVAPKAGDRAGEWTWKKIHSPTDVLDIDPDDYELVYLTTYVWSPRDMTDAAMYCGSDDFIELWVNGRCVHVYKNERRGIGVDEVLGVHLRAGWNVITAKVVDVSHGYQAYLCLVDDRGTPMGDAPITLTPPEGLTFCSEQEAMASKAAAHERGQEKIPPETAYFSPAQAAGADYPVRTTFTHTAQEAPVANPRQPLPMATAGQGTPVEVTFRIESTGEASAKPLRVVAELFRRDQRAESSDPIADRVVQRQEAPTDLAAGAFQSDTFRVPTDEVGYYGLEVALYDGQQRVRLGELPVAVVSPPDFQPQPLDTALPPEAAQWQPGDHARHGADVTDRPETRKVKFWPTIPLGSAEIASPAKPNFLELGRAPHGGLGHVTPTPGAAPKTHTIRRQDWIENTHVYTFDANGETHEMLFAGSNATQAVLAVTDYPELTVLEGLDGLDLGAPSHVAYRSADGIRVEAIPAAVTTLEPQMAAPWLLFWFSGAENWNSVDIPVLVVLQHRPQAVQVAPSGVTLRFAEQAGAVAVLPLLGTRIITPDRTAGWSDALPQDIAIEADFWAQAMRNYPIRGKDFFRIEGGDIQARIDYEYLSTEDDWGTQGLKFAPYPYWVALAAQHPTSVVALSDAAHRTQQLHPYGPVAGEIGDGAARFTLRDMTKYVDEVRVVTDVRRTAQLERAYEDLSFIAGHGRYPILCSMTDLGGQADREHSGDNFLYHRVLLRHNGGWKFGQHCFENENSMICNLTHALAYLPQDERQNIKALLMRFEDAGTMLYRWQAFNEGRLMFEDTLWFMSRFLAGQWSYGHYTGHWQMVRDRWPLLKAEYASIVKESSWANLRSCGSEESNLLYQGAIGYARCARAAQDVPEYLYGVYWAGRLLALQQALWMTIDNTGHQTLSWFAGGVTPVPMAEAGAKPRRPAYFYWWMMSQPIYQTKVDPGDWHASVISPFSYPYYPEIMRFHTERNEPFIQYYLAQWENYPQWWKGKTGGWGVYFGATEFIASRAWMVDYLGESAEQMMDKYMEHHWGAETPQRGGYEFNNRGWMSLPKALTGIIEASGTRRWVEFY